MGMSALLTVAVELICVLPLSVFSENNCATLQVFVDNVLDQNVNCMMYVTGSCNSTDKIYNLPNGLNLTGAIDEDITFNIVNKRESVEGRCVACYGIILEWTGPKKDLNRQAIKGYIVHFTEAETGGILCRVLDLRKFNFKSPNIKFIFEVFPINRQTRNTRLVDIFTVPLPPLKDFEEGRKYHHQIASLPRTIIPAEAENPSGWTTMISLKRIHGKGIVEGNFLFANDAYGFANYTVQLVRKGSTTPTAESCIQHVAGVAQGKFMFSNITAGLYYLQVKPFDSYFNVRDKCLCWLDKGILIGKDCDTCSTSVTSEFSLYDTDIRKESPIIQPSLITSTMKSPSKGHKSHLCIKVVCFIMTTAVLFL